ncbi:hypothetical protein ACFU8Q_34555 [Streptomyces sp. NPDC057543]|uniref:hypothetical protein n=1 Tax=Streptomyces sp. NPDC057543 TaxID=3346163 RepID=UPI0036A5F5FB
MAVKAVTDHLLGGDADRVAQGCTRFAGVFFPGEILRLHIRDTPDGNRLTATAADRDDAVSPHRRPRHSPPNPLNPLDREDRTRA